MNNPSPNLKARTAKSHRGPLVKRWKLWRRCKQRKEDHHKNRQLKLINWYFFYCQRKESIFNSISLTCKPREMPFWAVLLWATSHPWETGDQVVYVSHPFTGVPHVPPILFFGYWETVSQCLPISLPHNLKTLVTSGSYGCGAGQLVLASVWIRGWTVACKDSFTVTWCDIATSSMKAYWCLQRSCNGDYSHNVDIVLVTTLESLS